MENPKAFDCENCEFYSRLTDGKSAKDKICVYEGTNCKFDETNEEWFCNLTTEDKARYMCNIYEMGKNSKEYFMRFDKAVEWLKRKHYELS